MSGTELLPPTLNNLDRHQRMRLMRSTRKLCAVLGTTPCLLDPLSPTLPSPSQIDYVAPNPHSRTPLPSSKARRRRGRVFHRSPSSSISSLESLATADFFAADSPASSRASSPEADYKPRPNPRARPPIPLFEYPIHTGPQTASTHSLTVVPAATTKTKTKTKQPTPSAKQPLSRPLLLRLRSVPVAPSDTRAAATLAVAAAARSHRDSLPPSPLSPAFPDSTPPPDPRRKKMAKLARTLGENVPPELVFPGHAPHALPLPTPPPEEKKRRSGHGRSMSAGYPAPPSAGPADRPTHATSASVSAPAAPTAATSPRPRPPRLHIETRTSTHHSHPNEPPPRSARPFSVRGAGLRAPEIAPLQSESWGKRKEREWSGEWNVRDMGDVVRGLRELRGR